MKSGYCRSGSSFACKIEFGGPDYPQLFLGPSVSCKDAALQI
jgi:hypothetical protein